MSIKILYFASLREEIGRGSDTVDSLESMQVSQLWKKATGQGNLPGNLLVAINQEYCEPDARVNDGDEVAFFPPVTGG